MDDQEGGALPRWLELAVWLGIALGVLARVVRYAANRPLWTDEAMVALLVLRSPLGDLLAPRADLGVTPIGFLLASKAVTKLLGGGELALRLLPFLAGLAALPVFRALARGMLARRDALVALLLFAICEPLIFYSSELKPYSGDVLVGLLILWCGMQLLRGRQPPGPLLAVTAAVGAVGIWFSLPAIFVCGGLIAASMASALARSRCREAWAPLVGMSLAYAASFLVFYFGTVAPQQSDPTLGRWWAAFYPPLSLAPEALAWYPRAFLGFFNDPLGFPAVGVAAVTFLVGALRFARTGAVGLLLLLAPLGLAFGASLLQLAPFPTSTQYQLLDGYYPFFGRVLLFSVPPALIVVAAGIGVLIDLRVRPLAWLGGAAVAVLLATPLYVLVRNTISPPVIQDMRTLAEQMRPHAEASDLLLTLGYAEPTVEYYALRYGLPRPFAVLRVRTRRQVETTQRVLGSIPPGRRFWFATVHHPHWPTRSERETLLPMFDRIADELERFESYRGDAHLYRRR